MDDALMKLAGQDSKVARLVKLRYFAGLSVKRAANILSISPRTANHYWFYAKARLRQEIEGECPLPQHDRGHDAEAEKWLDKATEWTDKILGEHKDGTSPLAWNRRLTLKLLRDEAEEMIGKDEK